MDLAAFPANTWRLERPAEIFFIAFMAFITFMAFTLVAFITFMGLAAFMALATFIAFMAAIFEGGDCRWC